MMQVRGSTVLGFSLGLALGAAGLIALSRGDGQTFGACWLMGMICALIPIVREGR